MPRFVTNLGFMFHEFDFLDRFDAAAAAGFQTAECHWPYEFKTDDIAAAMRASGVKLCGLNTRPGDPAKGEAGLAALPGREADFARHFDEALDYARALSIPMLHVMAGKVPGEQTTEAHRTFVANLKSVVSKAEAAGMTLLIEPINTRDMPGYFLNRVDQAATIIDEIGSDAIKIMYDMYHVQIMQGDLLRRFEKFRPYIGHVQFAGVPDRAEPDQGEIAYSYIFSALDQMGWEGLTSAEYRPRTITLEGLGWGAPYGIGV